MPDHVGHGHGGDLGTSELEQNEDLRSTESDYEGVRGGMGTDIPGRLPSNTGDFGVGPPI